MVRRRAGVGGPDRIDPIEQRHGAVAIALARNCDGKPGCGMGVLAAIFTNAGRIGLDVARFARCSVEGGVKEPANVVVIPDEVSSRCCDSPLRLFRITAARWSRTGMRDP